MASSTPMTANQLKRAKSPNGARLSWREVAQILADRLVHQDSLCDKHGPNECPFCADADAMRIFREKLDAQR